MAYDMFNNKLNVNDRVRFFVEHKEHEGMINDISPSGVVKINALVGEFRRKGNNVIRVNL